METVEQLFRQARSLPDESTWRGEWYNLARK